jgi:hypothetical protein
MSVTLVTILADGSPAGSDRSRTEFEKLARLDALGWIPVEPLAFRSWLSRT